MHGVVPKWLKRAFTSIIVQSHEFCPIRTKRAYPCPNRTLRLPAVLGRTVPAPYDGFDIKARRAMTGEEFCMEETTATRSHYLRAWPLLLFCVMAYFITATVSSSMNIAAGILEEARGWSSVLITSMISVASVGNVVMGFIAGRLCSKHSPKILCFVWAALYLVGLVLLGISKEFAIFSVAMVVANAAASAWGFNTVPVFVANWFPTKKGAIQGFVSMGIPLGAGFSSMAYNFGMQRFGIDGAFIPFMVIAAVALVLLGVFVTVTPEEHGLVPDTMDRCEKNVPILSVPEGGKDNTALTGRLLHDRRFMALSVILGIQLLYSGGLMVQIAPRLFELGYSMDEAINAMLVSALFACVGSWIAGVVGDRIGSRAGTAITYGIGIIGILLNLTGTGFGVYASLAFIGAVTGAASNWPVTICADLFGREGFTGSFGLMQPVIQLVGAIGPSFFALISGATGSYFVSYVAGAALMLVGLVAFLLVSRGGLTTGEARPDEK